MNGGLIHNKKFNLVAFLSMGLFLLIGFIDIFSWIFIMLPVVVCFYVYDIRHGAVYLTSGEISCFDYILYNKNILLFLKYIICWPLILKRRNGCFQSLVNTVLLLLS